MPNFLLAGFYSVMVRAVTSSLMSVGAHQSCTLCNISRQPAGISTQSDVFFGGIGRPLAIRYHFPRNGQASSKVLWSCLSFLAWTQFRHRGSSPASTRHTPAHSTLIYCVSILILDYSTFVRFVAYKAPRAGTG